MDTRKEFFKLESSKEVYNSKYKHVGDGDIYGTFRRVANTLMPKAESGKKYYSLLDMLSENRFLPAGRILSNIGTDISSTSTINCTVLSQIPDSMDGIMDVLKESARTLRRGSGVGYDFSTIRPMGATVHGLGAKTSGPVSMMKIFDQMCNVIESAGGRRGAQMSVMDIQHPDIMVYVKAKHVRKTLKDFNMSVNVMSGFMDLIDTGGYHVLWFWEKDKSIDKSRTVGVVNIGKNETPYDMKHRNYDLFSFDEDHAECLYGNTTPDDVYYKKIYETVKAVDLWDEIMRSTYTYAEPGVLFMDVSNKANILNSIENMRATNPCVVGDTLVAVADGRGSVPIKQLADEGKDVMVYAYDNDNNKHVIKKMRNPRLTGEGEEIYEITFDSGDTAKVTGNHEFRLTGGGYIRTDKMKHGDSIHISTRFKKSINAMISGGDDNHGKYSWIKTHGTDPQSEHRLVYETHNGEIPKGMVIHHIDRNHVNNNIDNLQMMSKHDHDKLHGEDMKGDKNPIHAVLADDERRAKYIKNMSESVSGLKNGRSKGYSNDDLVKVTSILAASLGRMFTVTEFKGYAKENGLPYTMNTKLRTSAFPTFSDFSKKCAEMAGVYKDGDEKLDMKTLKNKYAAELDGYETKIVKGTRYPELHVKRTCEECGGGFWVNYNRRENAFCSVSCANKYAPKKDGWKNNVREGRLVGEIKAKEEKIVQQITVYNDLKLSLDRIPFRKEWEEECKSRKIASRVGKNSPFMNFGALKKAAGEYNHIVVSVEKIGFDDVYNGTVDDVHNFFITIGLNDKNEETLVNTVNCGEQNLPPNGSCLLGSLNLAKYVYNPFNVDGQSHFDIDQLAVDVMLASEALDNVVEHHGLIVEGQIDELTSKRRHGLGITGVGSMLAMMGYRYGSEGSLVLMKEIMSNMLNSSIISNVDLARTKGKAPIFDDFNIDEIFSKENMRNYPKPFAMALSKHRSIISEHGFRFSHMLSIAPTGTISFISNNVSSGIEPIFSLEYDRRVVDSSEPSGVRMEHVEDYALIVLKELDLSDDEFAKIKSEISTTENITTDDHINMQAVVQGYVDSSISKTVNVPENTDFESFKEIYSKGFSKGLKGMTTFRFNPAFIDSVLTTKEQQNKTVYEFTWNNGGVFRGHGDEKILYEGVEYFASMLYQLLMDDGHV